MTFSAGAVIFVRKVGTILGTIATSCLTQAASELLAQHHTLSDTFLAVLLILAQTAIIDTITTATRWHTTLLTDVALGTSDPILGTGTIGLIRTIGTIQTTVADKETADAGVVATEMCRPWIALRAEAVAHTIPTIARHSDRVLLAIGTFHISTTSVVIVFIVTGISSGALSRAIQLVFTVLAVDTAITKLMLGQARR